MTFDRDRAISAFAHSYSGAVPITPDDASLFVDGGGNVTFADDNPDTITRTTGSWITDGFQRGTRITISGSVSNDGTYRIASVTALVITLEATETLVAEVLSGAALTATGLMRPFSGLWIGGAGNVSIVTNAGDTVTHAVPVGLFPVGGSRVRGTGTTATNIVALYY